MSSHVLNRLLIVFPTLLGALTLIFLFVHILPGDPVRLMLGDSYTVEAGEIITQQLGLDKPLYEQYWNYIKGLATGNLGISFRTNRNVMEVVLDQFPFTVSLALASLVVSIIIGIPAGITAAVKRNQWPDYIGMLIALFAISMPSFWFGIVLLVLFSLNLGWFPTIGVGETSSLPSLLHHLALPAIALGARSAALIARTTRSSILEVLNEDYIRTGRAKGLRERVVLYRHAFRNALIPVITILGIDMGRLLGGSTIVEIVFSRAGIGQVLIRSVLDRDYPQVQATLAFYVVLVIFSNLLADLGYSFADPRIRYE